MRPGVRQTIALAAGAIPALLEEREGRESLVRLATELGVSRRIVLQACRALRHHGYVALDDAGDRVELTESGWEVVRAGRRQVSAA